MKTYTFTELSCIDTPILVPLCEGAELPQSFADYPVDTDQLDLEAGKQYYLLAPKGSSEITRKAFFEHPSIVFSGNRPHPEPQFYAVRFQ